MIHFPLFSSHKSQCSPYRYDDDDDDVESERDGALSLKERMRRAEKEKESVSTLSSASKGEISNISSSVGHLGVGVNNPALETTPMGTLERKKAAEAEEDEEEGGYVETEGL